MVFLKKLFSLEKALFLVICLFAFLYLLLAWFNTLAHDDQQFLYLLNEYGFFGSVKYYYLSWQGRVSAYVFTNLTLLANRYTNGLFIWFVFLVALFISGIYFLVTNLFKRLEIKYNSVQLLLFTSFLFIFFQEIVYDKSTIFWIATSTSYYTGLAFMIAGTALIFSIGSNYLKLVMLFIIFLIVGCSLENLAFISFFIILAFLPAAFVFKANRFFNDIKPKVIISVLALVAGIAIMMLCPGLEKRRAAFPKPDMITAIKITANSFYHFYKFMFLPELGRIMLFSSPFIYLGNKLNATNKLQKSIFFVKTTAIILATLVSLVALNFLIMAKGTGGMGQPRTLFLIAFFIAVAFSAIGFISGYTSQISKPVALLLSYSAIVVFFISLSQNYLKALPESIRYSESEKSRIEFLLNEKAKRRTESIVLDSLYYNQYVIYRTDEISQDTAGFWNQALKTTLDLDFNISAVTKNYSED